MFLQLCVVLLTSEYAFTNRYHFFPSSTPRHLLSTYCVPGIRETDLKETISAWIAEKIRGALEAHKEYILPCVAHAQSLQSVLEEGQCVQSIRAMEGLSGLLKELGCCPNMLMTLCPQVTSWDKQKRYHSPHFIGFINDGSIAKMFSVWPGRGILQRFRILPLSTHSFLHSFTLI